jgi:hypothetical protein
MSYRLHLISRAIASPITTVVKWVLARQSDGMIEASATRRLAMTAMQAMSGLLRPVDGSIILNNQRIDDLAAHVIAAGGLALVPEGRQMFTSVLDNILLGAYKRSGVDARAEPEALLQRLPRLREPISTRIAVMSCNRAGSFRRGRPRRWRRMLRWKPPTSADRRQSTNDG